MSPPQRQGFGKPRLPCQPRPLLALATHRTFPVFVRRRDGWIPQNWTERNVSPFAVLRFNWLGLACLREVERRPERKFALRRDGGKDIFLAPMRPLKVVFLTPILQRRIDLLHPQAELSAQPLGTQLLMETLSMPIFPRSTRLTVTRANPGLLRSLPHYSRHKLGLLSLLKHSRLRRSQRRCVAADKTRSDGPLRLHKSRRWRRPPADASAGSALSLRGCIGGVVFLSMDSGLIAATASSFLSHGRPASPTETKQYNAGWATKRLSRRFSSSSSSSSSSRLASLTSIPP